MNGIVTRLPEFIKNEVESIWKHFNSEFEMDRVMSTSFAHITWVIAHSCEEETVGEILKELRKVSVPFVIKTNGIGIFTGKRPAMYIQIKPCIEILNFQSKIYRLFSPYAQRLKKHYKPEVWIPHISIAIEDLTLENVSDAVKFILNKTFKYDIRIESFSLVRKERNQNMEIINRYYLY